MKITSSSICFTSVDEVKVGDGQGVGRKVYDLEEDVVLHIRFQFSERSRCSRIVFTSKGFIREGIT